MNELNILLKNMFPAIDFEKEDDLISNRRLDSLDILRLVNEVEQKYEISIPWEDISVKNFNSITAIYSLICSLRSENNIKQQQ